ncbi:MAG: DNA-binding protein [Anaerolineaceae bacterium]|nr:DNA-binding protein [Anaerolineaceae bacterium]
MSTATPTAKRDVSNTAIAAELDQIADLLAAQDANQFRVQAYRDAAGTVRSAETSLAQLVAEKGEKALRELPHIGRGIARIITSIVETGNSAVLTRLQGEAAPGEIFTQVPGIGPELAQRIAEELGIATLEELEVAAHNGRLQQLPGFGHTRVRNIRVSLAGLLNQSARRRAYEKAQDQPQPDVATLLVVDEAYRKQAEAGELRRIAPKRFNPDGKAWLPIMHAEQDGWEFTALFSNTARAHELGKTDDWVVLYYSWDGQEDQATAVTETRGPLTGKRVIRGRERESQRYYEQEKQAS